MKTSEYVYDQNQTKKIISEVTFVTITVNVILSAFKLFAGIFASSGAMVSDAIHTLSDVLTTVIAYIGVRMSKKEADDHHNYGHDRFECVVSLILAGLLLATGLGIGYSGIKIMFSGNIDTLKAPACWP